MRDRAGRGWPLLAGVVVALVALSAACGPPAPPPNVVLIVADTLRADSVSINGHPVELTPVLDGLAREGVNFSAAYAHSTWTKPSMASLMTGTYPDTHGIQTVAEGDATHQVTRRLSGEFVTLAERLQEAGYTTAAFGNQVQLQEKFGFDQGFDLYEWGRGLGAHKINLRLQRWLEKGPAEPLFVYVHYLDPHWPYYQRVDRLEDELGRPEVPDLPKGGRQVQDWFDAGVSPEALAALRAQYDYGAAFTDQAIGIALDLLAEHEVLDDAIVVVTSDHGEGFGEHGKLLHGYEPYEEVLRVPLIVRVPQRLGFHTGTIDTPVGLVDVMPTLLEAVGLEVQHGVGEGRSLVPLLRGQGGRRLPVYSETHGVRSLVLGEHKLIRHLDGRVEFFDLATDPLEQDPLPCTVDCQAMAGSLDAIVAAAQAVAPGAEAVELDEADLERLRALGYLDD